MARGTESSSIVSLCKNRSILATSSANAEATAQYEFDLCQLWGREVDPERSNFKLVLQNNEQVVLNLSSGLSSITIQRELEGTIQETL